VSAIRSVKLSNFCRASSTSFFRISFLIYFTEHEPGVTHLPGVIRASRPWSTIEITTADSTSTIISAIMPQCIGGRQCVEEDIVWRRHFSNLLSPFLDCVERKLGGKFTFAGRLGMTT
jgi:hypothetical protein